MRLTSFLIIIIAGSCGQKNPDERLLFFNTRTVMNMDSLVKIEDATLPGAFFGPL
jgi:hypothetical protein